MDKSYITVIRLLLGRVYFQNAPIVCIIWLNFSFSFIMRLRKYIADWLALCQNIYHSRFPFLKVDEFVKFDKFNDYYR